MSFDTSLTASIKLITESYGRLKLHRTEQVSETPFPDLAQYSSKDFVRGRSKVLIAVWTVVDLLLISSWIPGSWHRRLVLKLFGAHIGAGVVLKPRVRVKFPWRLAVGDHSWIGEGVWIDNLAEIKIGAHACISQGVYLCTGSHDWVSPTFDLITKPIEICDGAWISARSVVGPGVKVGEGAVLVLGSTVTKDMSPWMVYAGVPAEPVRYRHGRSVPSKPHKL